MVCLGTFLCRSIYTRVGHFWQVGCGNHLLAYELLRFTIPVLSRVSAPRYEKMLFYNARETQELWETRIPPLAWPRTLTEIAYGVEAAQPSSCPIFLMHQVSCTENHPFLIQTVVDDSFCGYLL